jgi:predicted dehydrogenase
MFSRRRFLSRTGRLAAGAAGGLALLSRPSVATARGANERVVCALIGVGSQGTWHARTAAGYKHATVSIVCDVNERNRRGGSRIVRDVGGKAPKLVADFRRVLDESSVDAVFIATPHHWHCPIAIAALDAGKHVYVEKPASHVFSEGRLLMEAAGRSGRVVQHGTQMRSSKATAAATEILASGLLGDVYMVRAWSVEPRNPPKPIPDEPPPQYLDYDMWLGPAPTKPYNRQRVGWTDENLLRHHGRWPLYRDYGNGEIGDDGIHDLDLACWGIGATTHPVRITAHGSSINVQGESEYPNHLVVNYEYGDGRVVVYETRNWNAYKMYGFDSGNILYGTEGYMLFSRRGYFQTYLGPEEEKGPGMGTVEVRPHVLDGNRDHIWSFIDCIRSGAKNTANAGVAHLSCALVHLGEIAYRTGRALNFDPKTETFRDDSEANDLLTKTYRTPWGLGGD